MKDEPIAYAICVAQTRGLKRRWQRPANRFSCALSPSAQSLGSQMANVGKGAWK